MDVRVKELFQNSEIVKKKLLKAGSDKIIYWLNRYSFLLVFIKTFEKVLGFIMSKNARGCILNLRKEYKTTNLLYFLK